MKSTSVYLLVSGLVVALAATGCKSPVNTRTMYDHKHHLSQDQPPGPPIEPPNNATNEPEPTPVPPTIMDRTQDASMFEAQTIYFGYDSAAIKATEKGKAHVVAEYLQSHPQSAILIEGNCDERGTEEYNRALGERRALAAREALLAAGITPERIDLISYGEDKPVDPGHDESAWQKNRRAAFVLLSKQQ